MTNGIVVYTTTSLFVQGGCGDAQVRLLYVLKFLRFGIQPMPCALCRRDRKLCKSHIIPRFLYAKMFEGGQKAYLLSTDGNERPKKVPDGAYEKLLCQECETRFSIWENYAKRVIFGGEPILPPKRTPLGIIFRGLDYQQFKLFQLSML